MEEKLLKILVECDEIDKEYGNDREMSHDEYDGILIDTIKVISENLNSSEREMVEKILDRYDKSPKSYA